MQYEIRRLHDDLGITTIYVTHDQREALIMSDRVAVMNSGRIQQIDTPQQIYDRPSTRFVAEFMGEANIVAPGAVRRIDGAEASREALMIRAESFHLDAELVGRDGVALEGTLRAKAFRGENWLLTLALDGRTGDSCLHSGGAGQWLRRACHRSAGDRLCTSGEGSRDTGSESVTVIADPALAADARRERRFFLSLSLPALVIVGLAAILPIVWIIRQSFLTTGGKYTVGNYEKVLSSGLTWSALVTTLELSRARWRSALFSAPPWRSRWPAPGRGWPIC